MAPAAARAKGMTADQHAEPLRVIMLTAKAIHIVSALPVPVDPELDVARQPEC